MLHLYIDACASYPPKVVVKENEALRTNLEGELHVLFCFLYALPRQ